MNVNEIIASIQAELSDIEYQPELDWTRQVYFALHEASRYFQNILVCAKTSILPATNFGEWLWDFTWLVYQDGALRQDENGNPERNKDGLHNLADGADNILSVPMVAESEWGDYYRILNDFDKLLVAGPSTLLRVMIFDGTINDLPDDFETQLRERIEQFDGTREGDTYLFAVYDPDVNRERLWRYYKVEAKVRIELIE